MVTNLTTPLIRDLAEGRVESLDVVDWSDPVVAGLGFDAHSEYVEMFWLPVLGPTATWLLRRLVRAVRTAEPIDGPSTAAELGIGWETGRINPFLRALQRLDRFGLVRTEGDRLAVRTMVPPIASRQMQRLPEHLRRAHPAWVSASRSAA